MIDTAHDVSAGGEIVALAEMALVGGIGVVYEDAELEPMIQGKGKGRPDAALFGENGISYLIAVPEERWEDLQQALGGVPYDSVGLVEGDRIQFGDFIDLSLDELREAYERDLFE